MVQDGKAADDKRNLSRRKLAHQFVAVRVLPVQHRKVRPETASSMHALELVRDPARLFLLVGELNDANLLAFRALGAQQFFGKIGAHGVLPDDLRGHAQNVRRRAVILRQADAEFSRVAPGFPPREFLEKKLKTCERSAAKAVDGLVVVADRKNISRFARQQLQQPQLCDVGVLKLIHQNVPIALPQRFAERRIGFQQRHRPGNQRPERDSLLFAQQFLAGAIGARNFLLPRHRLFAFGKRVGIQHGPLGLQFALEQVGILLVVFRGNQFVLAARKELHEIIQEFSRLRQLSVFVELHPPEITPEQDPVVLFAQQHALRVGIFQQRFAKRMKRSERHCFSALARGFHYAAFHFARGLLCERQSQDVFAGQFRIRMQ